MSDPDPIETIAEVIGGVDYDYEQRDQARRIVIAIRTSLPLRRSLWLALTADNPLSRLTKAPSEAAETTEPVSGTTSYTGVVRGADEAEALAAEQTVQPCSLAAHHTAHEVERLAAELQKARATIERRTDVLASLDGTIADQEGTISLLRTLLKSARATIEATNTPHNDPEFGFDKTAALSDPGEEGVSESVAQHVCDCPRHVAYRENLAANTATPMCLVHPEHFVPCSRCLGYGCTACDNGVQAADDRRSL